MTRGLKSGDCAYEVFNADFLPGRVTHAAILRGNWLAQVAAPEFYFGDQVGLSVAGRLGGPETRFLLALESQDDEILSHKDRISLYLLNGSRLINRALFRRDDTQDIRVGMSIS